MTINAGPDISVTNVNVVSATLATATFTIAAGATPGVRDVTVTTPLGTTAALPFTIYEIPSINLGETKSGTLSIIDRASLSRPGSYGDLYRFVLSTPTPVAIDLKSTDFNAFVYLLSATGLIMSSDDSSGGGTDAKPGGSAATRTVSGVNPAVSRNRARRSSSPTMNESALTATLSASSTAIFLCEVIRFGVCISSRCSLVRLSSDG